MNDAEDPTAATGITPHEDFDDDDEVEVWVVNDDEEQELIDPNMDSGADSGDRTQALEAELGEAKQQWMRTLADFDNFRKRSEREKSDLRRYALVEPMRELLTVIDNLERALGAEGSVEDLKQGVEMTLAQLRELLSRRGIETVAAVGHPFDPAVHDAVSRFEDPAVDQPTVSDEMQRGYRIHDRLLRPAMVRVAMPQEPGNGKPGGTSTEGEGG